MLNMFDPTTLPIERPLLPFIALDIETDASGRLVPIDTTVKPIIKDDTPIFLASVEALDTKKSAPLISKTIPTTIHNIQISMNQNPDTLLN
jgi:hypothetical protein